MASERKRIVLKLGSGILATPRGTNLDARQFARIAREVAAIVESGNEVLVVSSGAVAAGLGAMGLKARPEELAARQACAAVGQGRLMAAYTEHFSRHKIRPPHSPTPIPVLIVPGAPGAKANSLQSGAAGAEAIS